MSASEVKRDNVERILIQARRRAAQRLEALRRRYVRRSIRKGF